MRYYDNSNIELFSILLNYEDEFEKIDLHNDYSCVSITINKANDLIVQLEESRNHSRTLYIVFFEIVLLSAFNPSDGQREDAKTIDNLQRCRYEKNGVLHDDNSDGKKCYLMEFFEGLSIELLTKRVLIFL